VSVPIFGFVAAACSEIGQNSGFLAKADVIVMSSLQKFLGIPS